MAMSTMLAELGFRPDAAAQRPIYLQLAAAFSEAIRTGRIQIGARLPSERLCAEQLGVSRTTVTAAYQELMNTGLVRGHVGRGTIVIADDPDRTPAGTIAWTRMAPPPSRPAREGGVAPAPGLISFGDGWLHPSLIPRDALAACVAKAMEDPELLTRSAPIRGLPALREALAESLRASGVRATPADILITGGAKQGLHVVARALVSHGDVVLCESPTWHGAFQAFRAAGAEVVGIPMDREGVDPEALEAALLRRRPKFVYLIPSFQCPTGRLMGLERRRRIIEICTRLRTPIVESHVYGDLSFGETLPSLKALDTDGIVIHQGSASKTISAALRIGWLVAPRNAMELMEPAKASLDLSTPALTQAVLAAFLRSGAYARHLQQFRAELRTRRDAMLEALATHCPGLHCAAPRGGIYLWVQLPSPLQAHEFEAAALREGVSVRGGDGFLPNGGASSHIRLCYAAPALADIATGAERLGKALRLAVQRSGERAEPAPVFASV